MLSVYLLGDNIGDGSGGGGGGGGAWGDMRIFEPQLHTTCARLRDHVVQIMTSQRTLDTWLPAAKKKKTASDRR